MNRLLGIGAVLALTVSAAAQTPVSGTLTNLPPVAIDPPTVLVGTEVSRPLQPVAATQMPAAAPVISSDPTKPPPVQVPAESHLPSSWSEYELLFWWPKAQPLPPLLTSYGPGQSGALGAPGSALRLGGSSMDTPESAGGRFTWGWASNSDAQFGYEVTYFFTGSRTTRRTVDGLNRPELLGRPIVNLTNNREEIVPVSTPLTPGRFLAATTNRMTGWEVTTVYNWLADETMRIGLLAGYRYFLNHEGLRLEQTTFFPAAVPGGLSRLVTAADQIDGHSRFHGAQIGFQADTQLGPMFVELVGKVAFGRSFQVVKIGGQTNFALEQNGLAGGFAQPFGVLSLPSNTGRITRSDFAVLPEGEFKIGYRCHNRSRIFVGYNFLYLSEAVRPGDQVDRTIDPRTVPLLAPNGTPAIVAADRPMLSLKNTDFWAQGLVFGVEWKY